MRPLLFLFMAMLLLSFKGKDKGVTDEKKRIAILTTGRWQLADNYAWYMVNGQVVKNSKWQQLDSCFKDNIFIYLKSGRFAIDQGKIKCNRLQRQLDSSANWSLDMKENLLIIVNENVQQPLYIEYLSDSLLEVNEFKYFGDSSFIKAYKHIR